MNGLSALRALAVPGATAAVIRGRMRCTAILLIFAFLTLGLSALPAQAASQDLTFNAAADAYVDEGTPTVAKGASAPTDCFVNDDVGSRRECRLRFVVSGVRAGDTITSAKVLMRNKGGAGAKLVNMSTVAASPVRADNTITWSNKPPTTAPQGADSTHTFGSDSQFAVNAGVVTGNATYNFALHSPPDSYTQGLNFYTKENMAGQPAPRLVVTISRPVFGINVRQGGAARINPLDRLADFGRIPWARTYYGLDGLPSVFNLTEANAIAPEHRLQMSFKRLPGQILDGSYDARITSYLNSIPAGWIVGVTYWHEPNGELAGTPPTFSVADYKAAWYRVGGLIKNSTSAATLLPMPNYTGPRNASFDDSWVVNRASMPANSILTWDKYGNPPPAIDGLPNLSLPYRGLYRRPEDVFGETMNAAARLGWGDSWGISELNALRRNAEPRRGRSAALVRRRHRLPHQQASGRQRTEAHHHLGSQRS